MVNEAAEHEAEDKERREQIERRNKLDNLCYTLEKTHHREQGQAPRGRRRRRSTRLIKEARAAIEKQDDAAVKAALEKLEKEAHRIASVMYEKAGAGRAAPGGRATAARRGGEPPRGRRAARRRTA